MQLSITPSMKRFHAVSLLLVFFVGGCATVQREPTDNYSDYQLQEMGRKFLAARDLGQALKYLTLAEKRRPNDAPIQYDLAVAYYERGMRSDAFSHLKKALELKPGYPEVENALGGYYAEQDQLDLAQSSFERAIGNPFYSTPHLALYNLGLLYEKKGNSEAALRQYQEAVRLQPNYGLAYYRTGQLLEESGRTDRAREAYGKAIEFAPDMAEAYYRYGVLCYNAREFKNAAHSLNRVLKLAPYSTMAEDSEKYLELLQTVTSTKTPTPALPTEPRGKVSQPDKMIGRGLQDEQLAFELPLAVETPYANHERLQEPRAGADVLAPVSEPSVKEERGKPQIKESQIATPAGVPSSASLVSSGERLRKSDMANDQILRNEESATAYPSAAANPPVKRQEMRGTEMVAGVSAPLLPPAGNMEHEQAGAEGPHCYTVHVASFRDEEDAEKLQRRLLKKGFDALIKPINYQGVGRLYAVQLKPADSADIANELLMQVQKVRRGKMKIIKEPTD